MFTINVSSRKIISTQLQDSQVSLFQKAKNVSLNANLGYIVLNPNFFKNASQNGSSVGHRNAPYCMEGGRRTTAVSVARFMHLSIFQGFPLLCCVCSAV